ncbi:MAG: hypothetical protein KDA98_10015, partial [Acidimicrobiales bacterium]|nr:hypothetical protein [Acidimicrobiales bacterium]
EVVRGDDLASSSPRQRHLAELLGLPPVRYAHVPLVLGPEGTRLAKRDGAVTLAEQRALGRTPAEVCGLMAASLGLREDTGPVRPRELLGAFRWDALGRDAWRWAPDEGRDAADAG